MRNLLTGFRSGGESGVCVYSRRAAKCAMGIFRKLCGGSTRLLATDIHAATPLTLQPDDPYHQHLLLKQYDEVAAQAATEYRVSSRDIRIMCTLPRNSMWRWRLTWPVELQPILQAIDAATSSIYVFTPNFHDATLWHALRTAALARSVQIHIMCGYDFNAHPHARLIGFRYNRHMWQTTVCDDMRRFPQLRNRIHWRWYAANVVDAAAGHVDCTTSESILIHGTSPSMAHDKIFLFDDDHSIIGSLNCTTVSVHNASEILVSVRNSCAVRKAIWDNFASVRWHSGIPANGPPYHR
jgi:hypothetical protein